MEDRWLNLIERIGKIFKVSTDILPLYYDMVLKPAYTAETRHYHNLKHIEYMLDHVKDFKLTDTEKIKLEIAIWFHDLIYDASRSNNEALSAITVTTFCQTAGLDDLSQGEIVDLILMTKPDLPARTELQKILCDLDLRGFAEDWQPENGAKIRLEYSHLSDEEFNKGRKEFLKTMLNKKFIYYTGTYRSTLEFQARHNLTIEMESINPII